MKKFINKYAYSTIFMLGLGLAIIGMINGERETCFFGIGTALISGSIALDKELK